MDEYIIKFTSLLRYVPYLRDEKAKVKWFLSIFPTHMKERIEFVNPKTMDKAIKKARMCYQQAKEKGEQGKSQQAKKEHKSSIFKKNRTSNFKSAARSSVSKQFGRNHQRIIWPAEDKPTEASNKLEQAPNQKPPLQCLGCGEAHYYINCPQRGRSEAVTNLQEASTMGDVARNIPRINAALEDQQADYQSIMIELEGKLLSQPVSILVDPVQF